jgi:hypothetical protein
MALSPALVLNLGRRIIRHTKQSKFLSVGTAAIQINVYTLCTYTLHIHTYFFERRKSWGSSFSILNKSSVSWTKVNSWFDSLLRKISSFLLSVYVVCKDRSVSCQTCTAGFFIGRPNKAFGWCS